MRCVAAGQGVLVTRPGRSDERRRHHVEANATLVGLSHEALNTAGVDTLTELFDERPSWRTPGRGAPPASGRAVPSPRNASRHVQDIPQRIQTHPPTGGARPQNHENPAVAGFSVWALLGSNQ